MVKLVSLHLIIITLNKSMKKAIVTIVLSISVMAGFSQYVIEGTIKSYPLGKVYLLNYYANENKVIDSLNTDKNGSFSFSISKNMAPGLYQVMVHRNSYIDLIFNKENIRFITDIANLNENLTIVESEENVLFRLYTFRKNIGDYKLELIKRLLDYYPEEDSFYKQAKLKFISIQEEHHKFVDSLTSRNLGSFVGKIARFDKSPYIDPDLTPFEENLFLRLHYFDSTDFSDTAVLRTNVLPNKIIRYLGLFQNRNLSKEQLEAEFIKAVDTILEKTKVNQFFYEASLEYLIEGFNLYGFDNVLEYIANHAVLDEFCEYTEKSSELEKRIATLKLLGTGMTAPDFTATDIEGSEVRFSEIDKKNILLVFWASWCPHCTEIVPGLTGIYENYSDALEIIAISLDSSRSDYTNFLKEGNYPWINICDFKGWDTPLAKTYGIYATPTIILTDRQRKIITKPGSIKEIEKHLAQE